MVNPRKKETAPRRPGGGRKPKNRTGRRVRMTVNVDASLAAILRQEAQDSGKSVSDVLNESLSPALASLPHQSREL
jgi:hypothetical protein